MDTAPEQIPEDNAPQAGGSDGVRRRLSSVMKEKFGQEEQAELLTEDVEDKEVHRQIRRTVRRFVYVLVAIFLFGAGVYGMYIPWYVNTLPSKLNEPSVKYEAYKRNLEGYVDFLPAISATKDAGLSSFAQNASFAFKSSSDVDATRGLRGVIKIDINSADTVMHVPDVDLNYQFDWNKSPAAYFFINSWPSELDTYVPVSLSDGWLKYDPRATSFKHAGMSSLVSMVSGAKESDVQRLAVLIWKHGVKTRAIKWHIVQLGRKDTSNTRVLDLNYEVDPLQVDKLSASLSSDPDFNSLADSFLSKRQMTDIVSGLRSASGSFSVGWSDRLVHEASIRFDYFQERMGILRGTIVSSLLPIKGEVKLSEPTDAHDMGELLALTKLFGGSFMATTTPSL